MRTIVAAWLTIAVLAVTANADEALAKKIGMPKNFDPVAGVPKADRLEGDPRWARPGRRGARDLVREREELWNQVLPWQNTPEAIGMGGHPNASYQVSAAQLKRQQRAARARARHAAIISEYARQDAYNAAVGDANVAWGVRHSLGR